MHPSLERLRSVLDYDPETGLFVWRQRINNRAPQGSRAGHLNNQGYIYISLDGRKYAAHRLAWLYVYGTWPADLIDHIDLNRANNAIGNLREATHSTNKANRLAPSNNTSGIKGVGFSKAQRKWQASICRQYKQTHLGFFETKEEAAEAYRQAATRLFGEFARAA
jgi:hypothetical protein